MPSKSAVRTQERKLTAMVMRYGIPSRTQLPEAAQRQFYLANSFRRALGSLWIEYQQQRADLYAAYPEVRLAQEQAEAARTRVGELYQRARDERAQDRTTIPRQGTEEEIARAKKVSKALSAAEKAAKKAAETSDPALLKDLQTAKAYYTQAKKKARQDAAANGLYWATYNAVADAHRQAEKAVITRRMQGLPADIRRGRTDTLTVQLQRQAGDPVRSPELIGSGTGKWRNVFQLTTDPQKSQRDGFVVATARARQQETPAQRPSSCDGSGAVETPAPWPGNGDIAGAVETPARRPGSRDVMENVPEMPAQRPSSCDNQEGDPETPAQRPSSCDEHHITPETPAQWPNSCDDKWLTAASETPARRLDSRDHPSRTDGTFTFALGNSESMTLPVRVHRPLPADADICSVQIKRESIGHYRANGPAYTLSLLISYYTAAPVQKTDGAIGLHAELGWESSEEQLDSGPAKGYLLARLTPSAGFLPAFPGHPAGFVLPTDDAMQLVFLAHDAAPDSNNKAKSIQGIRSQLLDRVRPRVCAALQDVPGLADELAVALGFVSTATFRGSVARTRSTTRMARLALAWQALLAEGKVTAPLPEVPLSEMYPGFAETPARRLSSRDVLACDPPQGKRGLPSTGRGEHTHDLECWRRRDAHLHQYEANLRQQAVAARNDFYRNVAHWATQNCSALSVQKLPMAQIKRKRPAKEDTREQRGARSTAQFAAPFEFRRFLTQAAKRQGASIYESLKET